MYTVMRSRQLCSMVRSGSLAHWLLAIISWRLTGKALAPTALAMRRQKEFIAAAGHELRSPLAVVKASLDAACRTPVTERATLLRNAEQETDRMRGWWRICWWLANGDLDALPALCTPSHR